jgi:hypothetical protein
MTDMSGAQPDRLQARVSGTVTSSTVRHAGASRKFGHSGLYLIAQVGHYKPTRPLRGAVAPDIRTRTPRADPGRPRTRHGLGVVSTRNLCRAQ